MHTVHNRTKSDHQALVDAVLAWFTEHTSPCPRPTDPADADLMKAVWTYQGDRSGTCEGCNGRCGDICAPCTVAKAHKDLDHWSNVWKQRHEPEVVTSVVKPATAEELDALEYHETAQTLRSGGIAEAMIYPDGRVAVVTVKRLLPKASDNEA